MDNRPRYNHVWRHANTALAMAFMAELVIIRTDVADSGYWIILGGVLQMAAVSRWGAFASDPAPPMIAGPYRSLSAG
jgi:hypothetical protein